VIDPFNTHTKSNSCPTLLLDGLTSGLATWSHLETRSSFYNSVCGHFRAQHCTNIFLQYRAETPQTIANPVRSKDWKREIKSELGSAATVEQQAIRNPSEAAESSLCNRWLEVLAYREFGAAFNRQEAQQRDHRFSGQWAGHRSLSHGSAHGSEAGVKGSPQLKSGWLGQPR
jgi:hypothetical protein